MTHPLMGLLRTLLVLAAVWLVPLLFSRARGAPEKDRGAALPDMVRCEHCGLYLAAHEATRSGGRYFCSPEHAEAGRIP
ncbi:MAG: PP0621 family protein [Gammaproteobacteria bacterium]